MNNEDRNLNDEPRPLSSEAPTILTVTNSGKNTFAYEEISVQYTSILNSINQQTNIDEQLRLSSITEKNSSPSESAVESCKKCSIL